VSCFPRKNTIIQQRLAAALKGVSGGHAVLVS